MDRRDGGIVKDVRDIIKDIEELKTAQFTSQNSGMKFKQIESVSDVIQFQNTGGEQVHMVTNFFTPQSGRPTICVPHLDIQRGGFTFEYYHDWSTGYYNITVYDSSGTTYLGYMDVWPFYHRRGTQAGVYGWQTIIYTNASANFSIPFTINLRATDSGTHTLTVETSNL